MNSRLLSSIGPLTCFTVMACGGRTASGESWAAGESVVSSTTAQSTTTAPSSSSATSIPPAPTPAVGPTTWVEPPISVPRPPSTTDPTIPPSCASSYETVYPKVFTFGEYADRLKVSHEPGTSQWCVTLQSDWTEAGLRGSGFGLIFAKSIGTLVLPFDLARRELVAITFHNQLLYNYIEPAMSEVPYAPPSDLPERTFFWNHGALAYGEIYLSLYDFSGPLGGFSPDRFFALHFSLYDDSPPLVDEQWCIRDVAFIDSCGMASVRAAGDDNSLPDPPVPTVPVPTTMAPVTSTTDLTTDAPSTGFVTEETNTNQESSTEVPSSPDAGPTPEPEGEPAFELL